MTQEARERPFDELARGLANGAVSRRKALRWMGSALVGGALASIPGVAFASHKGTPHGGGGNGGRSSCAQFCNTLFGEGTTAQEECVSQGARGTGPCYSCTPGAGPGPNFTPSCTAPKTQFNSSTCECECPATTCGTNETLNTTTCLCESNPETCTAGENFCCPDPNIPSSCFAVVGGGTVCATRVACGGASCSDCSPDQICVVLDPNLFICPDPDTNYMCVPQGDVCPA
jgi:hypothetical protein